MQYLNFEEIAKYFQNKIEHTVDIMQENNILPNDTASEEQYKFAFFVNDGDYHKAVKQANNIEERTTPVIPVLIRNAGGLQDNNTSINIYLQKVAFEVYGWCDRKDELRDQWDDIELILSTVCADIKGTTDVIDGNTVKIEASDYPVLEELENRHFVAFFNVNVHVMFGAHLSNLDVIKINGVEIPYINFTETLTVEMLSDNKRTDMVKFLPNVSVYQLTLEGLYVKDNSVVNLLVNGCTTGSLYSQPFSVQIIRDGIVLADRTMYIKQFQTVRSFGSVVAYSAAFFPSYIEV